MKTVLGLRPIAWALMVSLGLNLALIGFIAGPFIHRPQLPGSDAFARRLVRSLPPSDEAIVLEALKSMPDIRTLPQRMDSYRQKLTEIMTAPVVDLDALNEAMRQNSAFRQQFEAQIEAAFHDGAPKLSLEGRRQLMRNLERPN
jgi:uncharacterized membrane protein